LCNYCPGEKKEEGRRISVRRTGRIPVTRRIQVGEKKNREQELENPNAFSVRDEEDQSESDKKKEGGGKKRPG